MADSGTLEPAEMAGREQLFADIASEFETQLDKAWFRINSFRVTDYHHST